MNRRLLSAIFVMIPVLSLSSCSGSHHVITCSGATCINNNGTVSIVLTATPPDPNSQLSIQAFTATITGITLTSTGGSSVNAQLNTAAYIAEFNRVTSDSTILVDGAAVPADTYTQVKINFSAPRVTFCTQTNSGVPGCAVGTLTSVSGSAGSATASINLSLGVNQRTGLAINVNLGNSLTLNNQTVTAVNFGAANVFAVATLPPAATATDLITGELSHIDDVMGVVSSVVSSAGFSRLTIHTTTRGDILATANSSTQFSTACATQDFSCVQTNAVAIVDTVLNADGTFTLVYYRPLFSTSTDLIEGVVTDVPNSVTNQLTLVATDSVFASSGSKLNGQLNIGDQVTVTLATSQPFTIVSKDLNVPANSFSNSTSISSVQPGQTVLFFPSNFSAQSGTTPGSSTTNTFALRFTRVSAIAASSSSPTFNATTFPPFFGQATAKQFQTTSGRLSLDGIAVLGSLPVGNTFSATALFIDPTITPTFAAQTIRAH